MWVAINKVLAYYNWPLTKNKRILMGRLIFNVALYENIKLSVKFSLSLLPFSMMICSPLLLIALGEWAETQIENFGFSVILFIMLSSFAIGWESNKLIAKWYFKWTSKKITLVFSNSEVPLDWFKINGFEKYRLGVIEEHEADDLKSTFIAYASIKSGLLFYIFLSCHVVIFTPFLDGHAITHWFFFLWPGPIYGVVLGGVIMLTIYYTSIKKHKFKQYIKASKYLNVDNSYSNETENVIHISTLGNISNYGRLLISGLYTLFCLVLGGMFIEYALFDDTLYVPSKISLQQFSGTVTSVEKKENYIEFTLSSSSAIFSYPDRAGASDVVLDSLILGKGSQTSILAQNFSVQTAETLKKKPVKTYEIILENKALRTYEESSRAIIIWRVIAGLMGCMIFIFGIFMIIGTWIQYKEKE
jgi:hypothetical protein